MTMRYTWGLLLALGLAPLGRAEAACTNISAVPYTITAPGTYCLTSSLTTNITQGAAIEIQADNVTVDLSGYTLDGVGGTTLAYGIHSLNRRAITVRNGTVAGYYLGVLIDATSLDLSSGHLVEKMLVRNCTYTGVQMEGVGMILRDNVIRDIGGPTGHHPNGVVACENGNGGSLQAINNVVDQIFAIDEWQSPDGMVLECINTIAIGNRISRADDQGLAVRSGICRDNVLQMVANRPYEAVKSSAGCTLLGKSNFSYPW
jgi:hypothetical protein